MQLFYKVIIKRVLKFAVFLQIVTSISFTMLQMPHILGIVKGVKFDLLSIGVMLIMRTLEWTNTILVISLISGCLGVLSADFRQNNISVFLLQMGKNKRYLIMPLLILSLAYSLCFAIMDGFLVPYTSYYFKRKFVEITKDKLINSIQPQNIIPYDDWNFTTLTRESESDLGGVLLNKAHDPNLTFIVQKMHFDNQKAMHLRLENGVGKIKHEEYELVLRFKKGKIIAPSTMVVANKTLRNLDLFELKDKKEFFRRFHIAIAALFIPFFIFVMLFGSSREIIGCCITFIAMLFYAMEIIVPFNVYSFFGLGLTVCWFYYRCYKKLESIPCN